LGNIRRTLAIAEHLVETRPDVTVLILSGSPMLHAFRIQPRIDYVKLPCLERTQADGYAVRSLGVDYKDMMRLRASIILNTVNNFDPHLVMVDKKPLGVDRELAPAFEMMHLRTRRPKMVLLLRDILDTPAHTSRVWIKHRYYEAIDAFYDSVLVLGSPEIFKVPEEYAFPESTARKVRYCGYIRRPSGNLSPAQVRAKLKLDMRPLVCVSAGGGGDGYAVLSCYLEGLKQLGDSANFHSLLFCGPESSDKSQTDIRELARNNESVTVCEFTNDIMSYMNAANVIVSMGGYNTVCEILTLKSRAIIIPRTKPVLEQSIRAQRMARLGLFHTIDPDQLTPDRLISTVRTELGKASVSNSRLYQARLNGLESVGNVVESFIGNSPSSREVTISTPTVLH
jgi:predicted glycosyltransferase